MSDYMDYPFLCDEKLGDRCKAQCSVCKAADKPDRFKKPSSETRRIVDETELTAITVVGERAYMVPKDVSDEISKLRDALVESQREHMAFIEAVNERAGRITALLKEKA